MLDTMTITKVLGAFCGTLLVLLLGNWVGELLYDTSGGHGGDAEQAYVIDTGGTGDTGGEEEQVDFAVLMAEADAGSGERVFNRCRACHQVDGTDATGPHLNGVVGRQIAAVDGFGYSDALAAHSGEEWTPEHLSSFLESPRDFAPGTTMSFAGLPNAEDRANLIAYLQGLDG